MLSTGLSTGPSRITTSTMLFSVKFAVRKILSWAGQEPASESALTVAPPAESVPAEATLTEAALAETDYQLLMAQQAKMAGFTDLDPPFMKLMESVKPYTMTSVERMFDLYKSVEYIVKAGVPGDILETGVWRGGSMMLVAKTLLSLGDSTRRLFLFDTFEGHPKPDAEEDIDIWGQSAVAGWEAFRRNEEVEASNWANVPIEEVRQNMASTGYPMEKIALVKGMVERTAAEHTSAQLALVRLDTDWYASARAALQAFWPKISRGGVLIIDDYGHYRGQRKAVDDYFAAKPVKLHRIDYSCRSVVKTD